MEPHNLSDNSNSLDKRINRKPAYADQFYPGKKRKLNKELKNLFFDYRKLKSVQKVPAAIIVPHAGYIFSGGVAAAGYATIPMNHSYKRVFIIASSHHHHFDGAAIYGEGNYDTPLGEVEIDKEINNRLIKASSLFQNNPHVHDNEHSVEVQLPFLQYIFKSKFKLVPIIIGTDSTTICKEIAEELTPWFTPENLFIISSDFSHYPRYEDAIATDLNTADAICQNSPEALLKALKNNKKLNIHSLQTSLCGWSSVLILLYLTQNKSYQFKKIKYQNSGDSKYYSDKSRVVGYWSIAIFNQDYTIEFTPEEQSELLEITRNSIVQFVNSGKRTVTASFKSKKLDKFKAGAFVTIYIEDRLRGCVGNFSNSNYLGQEVQKLAVSAASDKRFDEINPDELKKMRLEISILSPLERVTSAEEIIPGKHGVYLKKDGQSATFLPEVATRAGWNRIELLEQCATKAKIGKERWRDAEIFRYEASIIKE